MKVYLTGINAIKSPKKNSKKSNSQLMIKEKSQDNKNDIENIKEENIFLDSDKKPINTNNNNLNTKKNNEKNSQKKEDKNHKKINKNNNFISKEDQNDKETKKRKRNFVCQKEFNKMHNKYDENHKINEMIINELKEDYLEYIMLKEPKYADFDKISDEYRQKIYQNYKKYNSNLIIIKQKKKQLKNILFEMERSLISNYYVKDSSMLPIYEKLIEKIKMDILTKQQDHDGYQKQYDELYNQNYTIKRKVLDEIDIDRVNEEFYDQYKLLKIHAIVQVSKKQDTLSQIEDYHKKVLEEHEKEIKQKHKILKELKLEIEVFKEDEKDLVHKLKKIKAKREQLKKIIKERENKIQIYEFNYIRFARRYQKSFISMNKIFKSVNAKNLDDVLLDVNSINSRFNNLKNKIIKLNQDISNLNSIYSQLNKNYIDIQKQIQSKKTVNNKKFKESEQKKILEMNNLSKKEREEQNQIREIIQNNIGSFQNGITFIFEKIKLLVLNIKILKNIIPSKLLHLIHKYKNTPYKVNYEKIDKKFLKNFSFLFFQFCNIIFYLTLRSMCSGINPNDSISKKKILTIISVNDKNSLNLYAEGVRKTLKEYKHRHMLKLEKQKEINEKTKQKELEEKIDDQLMSENKAITQKQMYKRFLDYLHNKEAQNGNTTKNEGSDKINHLRNNNSHKNSLFFTGIESIKSQSRLLGTSSSSSINYDDTTTKIGVTKPKDKYTISLKQKEEFLEKNQNKLISLFSKYQNSLVKENDKNLYFQKKSLKRLRRVQSDIVPKKKIEKNKIINGILIGSKKNEEISSKKNKFPKLLDEDYEYDEEDEKFDETTKNNNYHKKNSIKNYYSFFRLNKDRANIYKKMNDLRKLQMSYFGGRFLNTKINSGELTSGENNFDLFINNYYKQQTHEQFYNNKKKRFMNYKKKIVYEITANKKFRSKSNYCGRNQKINFFKKIKEFKTLNKNNKKRSTLLSTTQKIRGTIDLPIFPINNNKFRSFSPSNNILNYKYKK